MTQEQWDFINLLVIVARFVQVFGFFFAILMLIKEFPIGYTFLVFAINLVGFFAILTGVLTRLFSLPEVLIADAIIIALSIAIFLKAYKVKKLKEKFPSPPKPFTRCPVCGSFIDPKGNYCVLMDSKSLLYFDTREHMEAFIKNPQLYRISKEINYDGVKKVCINKEEGWIEWGQSPREVISQNP